MDSISCDHIGYWSEIKLDIIREYAAAYSRILSNQPSIHRHLYIDAFAGWGIHVSKTTGDFVLGSPTNALHVAPPFSEYHFVDLDDRRIQSLQQVSEGRDDVTVYHGNCNEVLLDNIFPRCAYEDYARGLCLLDPYSLNVSWEVLKTAGKMKTIEVFYNFMIMDANMNILWRNPDRVDPKQAKRMERVWGDQSWRKAAYTIQPGLFGDIEEKASNERVIAAFRERLRLVAGFDYVPEPVAMRNTSGAIVYDLFFASHNRVGAKIVTDIFGKYRERL